MCVSAQLPDNSISCIRIIEINIVQELTDLSKNRHGSTRLELVVNIIIDFDAYRTVSLCYICD